MVICGVTVDLSILKELKAEGVKDSKRIIPRRRERLAKFLKKRVTKHEIIEFEPAQIDRLRGEGTNMNQIEAAGFAQILNRLNPPKAYIDSASANPEKFAKNIRNLLKNEIELVVEHRADDKYLPVSSASILAKVRRDERIEELKKKYGETGSGYPSDGRTIQFLKGWVKEHGGLPGFARKSWKTAERIKTGNKK